MRPAPRFCLPLPLTAVLGGVLLSGCASPDPCSPSGSPTLTIGTGEDAYLDLPDPPELDLVYGAQGGVHVTISLTATGLSLDQLWEIDLVGSLEGEARAAGGAWLAPTCVDGLAEQILGLRLIFDSSVRPSDLEAPLDVTATVIDDRGVEVQSAVGGVTVVVP